MNVYTDGIKLMCADLGRLHDFAEAIGLKLESFRTRNGGRPYYKITAPRKAGKAVAAGAVATDSKSMLRLIGMEQAILKYLGRHADREMLKRRLIDPDIPREIREHCSALLELYKAIEQG